VSVFKRGGAYWFNFWWKGRHVQRSTKQGNPRVARQIEAAYRTQLAKGEVGLEDRPPVPMLVEFMEKEFLPWAEATFKNKRKTFVWYRGGVRRLAEFPEIATVRLDVITGKHISAYVVRRQTDGLGITAINRELQILRRVLRLGHEWGRADRVAKVRMLPGETRRDRVLTPAEQAQYLEAAAPLLHTIAVVLVESGLRPEECYRLRWEHLSFSTGKYGTILVTHGKTKSARRLIPMTAKVRQTLESVWSDADKPENGWVFAAPTRSGHVEPSTLRGLHRKALSQSRVRPFVLYTLRHTFLTRLGASGCDAWTLARIAGHSSVSISARYVHPSDETVVLALEKLQLTQPPAEARI
jgi:integrase